ncbi:MAG: DUF4974 domain-containing protein [Rikenellaceae bacterium]|jgi:ferric-dicitrate binding protein FerR (iron transport regulator)|nr:DUF4974 domain-containing protein [Rikenellaceae bacterium]
MRSEIQYLFKVLEDPSLVQTDEFDLWIRDKKHYELFWNAKAAWDDFLLKNGHLPELETEWNRFELSAGLSYRNEDTVPVRKARLSRFFLRSAVAVFLLMLGCGAWFYLDSVRRHKTTTLVQALPFPQNVTMINTSGDTLLLDGKAAVYSSTGENHDKTAYNIIRTPRGKDFRITLCDGTEVLLNSESSLCYPARFEEGQRVVELKGEAYFKVAKHPQKPFIVKTEYLQTKALGTEFNVKAYSHSDPHVTLIEGNIAVWQNESEGTQTPKPGEDVHLSAETGSIEVRTTDVRKYTAWTSGFFFFEDESLENIMRELGRWYNVNVEFSDPKVMEYHFNFWVNRNRGINEAMELLGELDKVNITFKGNTIAIH